MTARASAAAMLAIAALGGCTLAPRYERPAAPIAPVFNGAPEAPRTEAKPAGDLGWREFFPDAELQRLIGTALEQNRDLRVVALDVEEAQARYRIARAGTRPALSADVDGTSQRLPAVVSPTGTDAIERQYRIGVGVPAFEVDFFGRVRSLKRSALEQYLALEETRSSAEIALVSEVANAWLALVADRALLALTRETLASEQDSLELTRLRFNSGVASEVDLHQAEIALHEAEVNIAAFTRRVGQDRNALEVLVGGSVGADIGAGEHALDAQIFSTELPAGLPADLLERRPDIRAAEHALRAANADIGAARAAFFPRITLTGFYGRAHDDLSSLVGDGGTEWTFSPQLTLPIFAGGANRATLDVAQVRKRADIARYELAIEQAFREVSDGLVARATLEDQLRAQAALTQAAQATYRLAEMRYRGGVDSYLTSLIAQRDQYAAERALIDARLARAANLVSLYAALGGGWTEESTAAAR